MDHNFDSYSAREKVSCDQESLVGKNSDPLTPPSGEVIRCVNVGNLKKDWVYYITIGIAYQYEVLDRSTTPPVSPNPPTLPTTLGNTNLGLPLNMRSSTPNGNL